MTWHPRDDVAGVPLVKLRERLGTRGYSITKDDEATYLAFTRQ